MHMKKTILALAIGVAAQGVSAYETEQGNLMADIKLRYESNDNDDGTADAAKGLIADAAIGFETKDYEGFKALAEYEIVQPIIDDYAPEQAGYDVIADPETREWNRAQISYKKDAFGAVVGRQRIILDNARFVGNVGWRANEQTFDAATLTYTTDAVSVHYSYVDQVNTILGTEDDVTDHLLNISTKITGGKLTGFAYLLENDDTEATLDTYGVLYAGSSVISDTKVIYSASVATQTFEAGSTSFDANYFALEGGVVLKGVTLALGNETLGSDSGDYAFETPLATKHAFNGWADKFLNTTNNTGGNGLSDTYVKAAATTAGINLVGFYHNYSAVEGSDDLGSELDLVASKVFQKKYTLGAKFANYSAGDTGVDDTKFWLWGQAKF